MTDEGASISAEGARDLGVEPVVFNSSPVKQRIRLTLHGSEISLTAVAIMKYMEVVQRDKRLPDVMRFRTVYTLRSVLERLLS